MNMFRQLTFVCALILSMNISAQIARPASMTPLSAKVVHQLTRFEGNQTMGNGVNDDIGWELTFMFPNHPPKCTKNRLTLTIWREKDIFHAHSYPTNAIDWAALEPMYFNGDIEHPVNPRRYGYVTNAPNVDESKLKVSQLIFEWAHEDPFTVYLPDYLFINMPLPDNPNQVENPSFL